MAVTPEELKPHVVYHKDHDLAIMCKDRKTAHDVWKRWKENLDLHAPLYIALVGREQDPAAEIVDVSE